MRSKLFVLGSRPKRYAKALAGAHPRVAGQQLGLGDLFEPLRIARNEQAAIQHAMIGQRIAAGACGAIAYDRAFADIVALANEAFAPDAAEIAHARRVVEASAAAMGAGSGAFVVDGRMVDRPFPQRAKEVVALARRRLDRSLLNVSSDPRHGPAGKRHGSE